MNKTATYRPTQNYYSAAGQKLMTEVSTDPALGGSIVAEKTRIYLSAMVLKGGEIEFLGTAEGRALSIESLHKNPDGEVSLPNYIDASSNQFRYEYQLKDHLGNLRVACRCGDPIRKTNGDIAKNNQNREPICIVKQNSVRSFGDAWGLDFGTNQTPPSGAGVADRYQYNSKERIQDLGIEMYDYGAMHYDVAVGRWSSVDLLADHPNQVGISPYTFLNNNPVNHIDPDGRLPIPLITGAIGAAGGLIYGLVKGKSWKETAALTAGGFVAGATLGFGTAGIAALGGIEAIGGAGANIITLGTGVAGGMLGNAAEQGVKVALGESSSFDKNEVVLNGAFGMSEVILGPAGDAIGGAAKNAVQDGLSQMFKPASRAEIRSTQRELSKQIRASSLPGTISKSEANSAAKQLVKAGQQQKANTLQGTIRISNGSVNVSVSAMQTAASEESKNKLINQ